MSDAAGYVFPLWFRGWGWGTLTGILHELDEILSHPTPSVLEVLLAVVEVTESGVTETQKKMIIITYKFSLKLKSGSNKTKEKHQLNNNVLMHDQILRTNIKRNVWNE